MVKLSLLSTNLLIMLNQILTDQDLCKLLYYTNKDPLSQPDLADTSVLMFRNLFPQPYDPDIQTDDLTSLRVFYLKGDLSREYPNGEEMKVFFDIICAKTNWLINDGEPKIRPYEIISHVVDLLDNKSISTLGKLHFLSFTQFSVNKNFDGIRVVANMNTLH